MDQTQKQEVVSELLGKFKSAAAIFLVTYRGLKVSEMTQIRRELGQVQGSMQVVKNRLVKRALADEKTLALDEYLTGPTAIAFAEEDAVGVAKVLTKYEGEFESLELRAGVVRGELIDTKQIEALSKLPSKQELYAKLLGTLMAPASNLVRVLQGCTTQLVRALGAVRDTKQE